MSAHAAHAEGFDTLWQQLPTQQIEELAQESGVSLRDLASGILSGDPAVLQQWPEQLLQAVRDAVQVHWGQMTAILFCACIGEMARSFASGGTVHRAMDLMIRLAVGVMLMNLFVDLAQEVAAVCGRLRSFTDMASPLLVAAMTLTGSPGMASAMPVSAVAADSLSVFLTTDYGLPLLRIAAALAAFARVGGRFRLNRLFSLVISTVKWMLGACMTGFLALMSMRTIALGSRDGATVQTVRYAVDNLLPIIGGELSDTVGSVLASAALVKNVAGIAVCLLLITALLAPLAKLFAVMLMLKLTAAGLDMLSADALPAMVDRFVQLVEVLMAILASVAALGMILAGAAVFTVGARG